MIPCGVTPGSRELETRFGDRRGAAETRFSGAGGRPLFEMAINLIARGDVSVAGIIIHRFALADLSQAYAAAHIRAHDCIRVAVEPE